MKVSEKLKKIWFAALMAAAGVNVVLWSLTWRLDYDASPGVFGRGMLSGFAVAACIVCVILSLMPVFFSGKGNTEESDLLGDTSRRGSEAAALASCFIIASSILTMLKAPDGGNRAIAAITLALSVPSALYFAAVCLSRNQSSKLIRFCAPFPSIWGIFMTLYHYLSTARAINDPIKVVCQFIPVGIMLYSAAEMKTRLSQCTKSYFFTTRAVLVTTGSVALSLVIDSLITAVCSGISRIGGDVIPELLVFAVRPHELTLAVAGLGVALYSLSRKSRPATGSELSEPVSDGDETESITEKDVTEEVTDENVNGETT